MRFRSLFVVFALILIGLSFTTPSNAQTNGNTPCEVPANGTCTSSFDVESGNTYSITLRANASGASFWVTDPSGAEIQSTYLLNLKTDSITLGPDPKGTYVLHFSNSLSSPIHVDIIWVHNAASGTSLTSIPEFPPDALVGTLAALALVAVYVIARRSTSGRNVVPP